MVSYFSLINLFSKQRFNFSFDGEFVTQQSPSNFLAENFKINIVEIKRIEMQSCEINLNKCVFVLFNDTRHVISKNYGNPVKQIVNDILESNKKIIYQEL